MTQSQNRRLLLFGSDGLRPDIIDPDLMPTYARLIEKSTRLRSHRTVYPSITRAILSSINTGVTPGTHGMTSGSLRYDNATPNHVVDSSDVGQIRALDEMTGGNAIQRDTLGDHMAAAGVRMALASSQTSGGAALWSRKQPFPTVNTSTTYGRQDLEDLRKRMGAPPPPDDPDSKVAHDEYTCRAAAELFVPDPSIQVIVTWMAEPDKSLHKGGLGSGHVERALASCERGLARIIRSMEDHGVIDDFDIMLVSDHGHATIEPHGSLTDLLAQAGEDLGDAMPRVTHTSRNIYGMPNEAPPTAQELAPLVSWLQAQPWVGALFGGTDEISALPGMLSLKDVWNGTYGDRAPLIATAGAWTDEVNEHGVPGIVRLPVAANGPSVSAHGNLSPYELHAFAAFSGPDFHENRDIETPTGSTDLLPTIMHLLGQPIPEGLDGRVLTETLAGHDPDVAVASRTVTPETPHPDGFSPELRLWQVGSTSYIDRCMNGQRSS